MNFTAIDFETATGYRNSICQIGLVRVEGSEAVEEIDLLVQPPDNFYSYRNIEVHGITSDDTRHAPSFEAIWPKIESFIAGQVVVAHNSSFDFSCLRKTLDHYSIPWPEYDGHCTCRMYKGKHASASLAFLCEHYGIPLDHHDALSDARACAQLYTMYLADKHLSDHVAD